MQKRMRQSVALAGLFVFLSSAVATKSVKLVYKAVGDKVVLTADSVAQPITAVMWKHGVDIAMDWYEGAQTYAYRQFRDRGMLNTSTGALTITGLTRGDSGSYTAEINQQKATSPSELLVISPVPKPSVSTWCFPEMTYCVFTCEGNTTDAEPVTFKWGAKDMVWNSTKMHNITKEVKEFSFWCMLDNPVSCKKSEPVANPFTTRNRIWMLFCLVPLVGGILLVCILVFTCKARAERSVMLPGGHETPNQTTSDVRLESNNVTAVSQVQETPTQDSASPVPPDTSDEPERSAAISGTSDEDPTNAVSPQTSNGTEISEASMSSGEEPSGRQEPPVDEPPQDEGQS